MTSRVSGSAQCRSSRITSSPRSPAIDRRIRTSASATTTSDHSAGPGAAGSFHSGTRRPSAARYGARSVVAPGRPPRLADSSASVSGRNAAAAPGVARPDTTVIPIVAARSAAPRTRRLLPTPASPSTATSRPPPAAAAVSAASTAVYSADRPTRTGQRTSVTGGITTT